MHTMNYRNFQKRDNLIEQLLYFFGIIEKERLLIEIDHMPDYDLSTYQRDITTDYVFMNKWRFSNFLQNA